MSPACYGSHVALLIQAFLARSCHPVLQQMLAGHVIFHGLTTWSVPGSRFGRWLKTYMKMTSRRPHEAASASPLTWLWRSKDLAQLFWLRFLSAKTFLALRMCTGEVAQLRWLLLSPHRTLIPCS